MVKPTGSWDMERDMVVVGSGSGAMTCALTAAQRGAKVIMVERAPKLGGGTAYSGGLIWMPNNRYMAEAGIPDSREEALTHLRRISGGKHDEKIMQTFVDTGSGVIQFVEKHAKFKFQMSDMPDYNTELPGGKEKGRTLYSPLFDAKELGPWQDKLIVSPHYPLPTTYGEVASWGGTDNVQAFPWDILGKRMKENIRGFGGAYPGYLLKACLAYKVEILLDTRARDLVLDETGRVIGIKAEKDGCAVFIRGRKGVLLGCGGFEWNEEMKKHMPWPDFKASTVPTNEGDGHIMALKIGAAMRIAGNLPLIACVGVPGEEHMGKPLYRLANHQMNTPGAITVNRQGKRFCNENFWQSYVEAMCFFDRETQSYPNIPAYIIFDQDHKDHYAVGVTMPGEEAPGWIRHGNTLRELATNLSMNPGNLADTVATFSEYARKGKDPEFHRGDKFYDRWSAGGHHKPNPCLAPIERPPFYGMEVQVGSPGTMLVGLVTSSKASVVTVDGEAINGLYACPNTAAHLAFGIGMISGSSMSQGMVFGYIAAQDATR